MHLQGFNKANRFHAHNTEPTNNYAHNPIASHDVAGLHFSWSQLMLAKRQTDKHTAHAFVTNNVCTSRAFNVVNRFYAHNTEPKNMPTIQ